MATAQVFLEQHGKMEAAVFEGGLSAPAEATVLLHRGFSGKISFE